MEKEYCAVCKEKEVKNTCDFPMRYEVLEGVGIKLWTCCLPMCEDCTEKEENRLGNFCPHHFALWEQRQLTSSLSWRAHVKRKELEGQEQCLEDMGDIQELDIVTDGEMVGYAVNVEKGLGTFELSVDRSKREIIGLFYLKDFRRL